MSESLPVAASDFTQPPLPSHVGKFKVMSRLGEGSTSEVFLCFDEFHQREVAVKRIKPEVLDDPIDGPLFARFFAAEAALVGRLKHPHVVQIFDAITQGPERYIAMEYVPGSTLRPFCRSDNLLPLEVVVEIGFKCAKALGYVETQGLIHRDIKPANILATLEKGAIKEVKITDFGSALNLRADSTQIHRVGSLAYMPPEQFEGATVNAQADMYSLGAVLYHLMTGHAPFEANEQSVLINMVLHQPPATPSSRRAGLSEGVDRVLMTALAKRPEHRFQSWDAFAEALAALITNREIPRANLQTVLDSERFNLLRSLDFFRRFGDVELWEVVHQGRWQRFGFGQALMRTGQMGRDFHIIAQGSVDVFREGQRVAHLAAGTSVGEMSYLAPSNDLRVRSADVIVVDPCTTISFTPESLKQLSGHCRRRFDQAFISVLVRRLHAAHEALQHPRRIM